MLQHDRQITISVGASRKATEWRGQTLFISEFYERLRVPSRGTETMAEYLTLPKAKQDDLKDVGGYVAGYVGWPVWAVGTAYILPASISRLPPGFGF